MKPTITATRGLYLHLYCLTKCVLAAPLSKRSRRKLPFYLRGTGRSLLRMIRPQQPTSAISREAGSARQASWEYQPQVEGNPWTSVVRRLEMMGFHPDGSPIEPVRSGSSSHQDDPEGDENTDWSNAA